MRAFIHSMRARIAASPRVMLLCLASVTTIACGGSDGPTTPPKPVPTFVRMQSDPGDYVGGGGTYEYTQANALIKVSAVGYLSFTISGDQQWHGSVTIPNGTPVTPGTYTGADWSGEGRGCTTSPSTITVDSVTYTSGALTAIDFRLEQRCAGSTAGLHATVHWRADDQTTPPGPVTPIPANLWKPDASLTPAQGNYVALVSDPGDYIGQGFTQTYTTAYGPITASVANGLLTVTVGGGLGWRGDFESMIGTPPATVGYYPGLMRYPFHNPAKGGLDWSGQGRGCNKLTGWFAVDRAVFVGGTLTALDLRFEQHCEGATSALRGAVHWAS